MQVNKIYFWWKRGRGHLLEWGGYYGRFGGLTESGLHVYLQQIFKTFTIFKIEHVDA